jgi:glycerophosphoryl diester phosphodiesterase
MQLFAHRGVSACAPENSMTAFQMALDIGASGIELDVRLIAGEAVVIHDADLDRTTNGNGSVYAVNKQQWQQLDAGDGYPPPTLQQVLKLAAGRCAVNIELKDALVVEAVAALIQLAIAEYGFAEEQLCVSAFDHHALVALQKLLPRHPVAPLISASPLDYAACGAPFAAQAIHSYVATTSQELVDDAHARGMDVRVYTVTRAEDLLRLHAMGVDAVFVNDVEWAREVLAQ